jgi:hypothetical protein
MRQLRTPAMLFQIALERRMATWALFLHKPNCPSRLQNSNQFFSSNKLFTSPGAKLTSRAKYGKLNVYTAWFLRC